MVQHQIMVEETARTCNKYLSNYHRYKSEEHRVRTFHSLMIRVKLQTVVHWVTDSEKGGLIYPRYACTKTGEPVLDVLRAKHPEACAPSASSINAYPSRPPDLAHVNLSEETVIEILRRLSGEPGPGVTNLVSLKHWLLQFDETSGKLRQIVVEFAEWLENKRPPWASYHALMSIGLI